MEAINASFAALDIYIIIILAKHALRQIQIVQFAQQTQKINVILVQLGITLM